MSIHARCYSSGAVHLSLRNWPTEEWNYEKGNVRKGREGKSRKKLVQKIENNCIY